MIICIIFPMIICIMFPMIICIIFPMIIYIIFPMISCIFTNDNLYCRRLFWPADHAFGGDPARAIINNIDYYQ